MGTSMGRDIREGVANVRCVACDRLTSSGAAEEEALSDADAVGRIALPDAMDCRSRRRGSCSTAAAIVAGRRKRCI